MIESLVEQAGARHRHRMAPLLREREMYLMHLLRRGTSHFHARSVAAYLIHIVRLMGFTQLRPVGIDGIERAGRRWARYKGPHRRKSAGKGAAAVFAGVAKNWFRFHGHLKIHRAPIHPSDELLRDFVHFLRLRQGLAPETIKGYSSRAGIFLLRGRRPNPCPNNRPSSPYLALDTYPCPNL